MIDQQLAEAFIHRPHTVMLRRLRPLSLRRLLALMVIESPLLDGSRDVTWGDLEQAVTICALKNPVIHLAHLSRFRSLRGRILRTIFPFALERHALRFIAYFQDYHALPESADEVGGEMAKAPWILRMVHVLKRNGYTEDQAWDMPTGEAFFRYATIQELDGAELNLIDAEERELLELARSQQPAPLTSEPAHG